MPSNDLLKAIAVTAELTGTQLSREAAIVMANDLGRFPEPQVIGALTRCRRECRGRLTIADVIDRLEDGRPGPEEAWAMIPQSESESVVWTDEMRFAFGVAGGLENQVQARMAFVEKYRALVSEARNEGKPVRWEPSLGHDKHGREDALRRAVELGRIPLTHAQALIPDMTKPDVPAYLGLKSIGA